MFSYLAHPIHKLKLHKIVMTFFPRHDYMFFTDKMRKSKGVKFWVKWLKNIERKFNFTSSQRNAA